MTQFLGDSSRRDDNSIIWERRYAENHRVAKWPFEMIVGMVMRRFRTAASRASISILDYGCGGGNNLWFLAKEGFDAYACDVAPSALSISKKRLEDEGLLLPDNHFAVLNDDRLPYPDNFFSAIIDRESLCQSSWPEVQRRVAEFHRILAPGGWYFGVNFSCHHPDLRFAESVGMGDYREFTRGLFSGQGMRHLFSANEIVSLFKEWELRNLAEIKVSSIIADSENYDTSEYLVEACKRLGR